MPTIIMTKVAGKLDSSVKKKAYTFLEKLAENDATPGLHIEPIHNSADPRVRTGRVDLSYRAVLFKLTGNGDTAYVFYGIWAHDEAIAIAQKTVLEVNPVNGIPEIHTVTPPTPVVPVTVPVTKEQPLLVAHGLSITELVEDLGIDPTVAAQAFRAVNEEQLETSLAAAVEWQALALIDLATGASLSQVKQVYGLTESPAPERRLTTDASILQGLQHPAAQVSFAYINDDAELRRILEEGNFTAWRTFLHPEQRRYAARSFRGPYRVTGGAGTGKTVIVVHRAARLSRETPTSRILVTTFTRNLAQALEENLRLLDPDLPQAAALGEAGIHVTGIDALAAGVLRTASNLAPDIAAILGEGAGDATRRSVPAPWREAIDTAGANLPENLRSEGFFTAEYGMIVLPNRVTTREQYYRVRRPGRGVALDRTKRAAVWDVIESMRAQARIEGTWDYTEAAAIAASHLHRTSEDVADHVLIDEGQDLSPTHWQLLRAAVSQHADDLFIAEDSHQRIYGRRIVLSQFGIRITGRSNRLTLNYRTTAQNLAYALGILKGGTYSDLDDELVEAEGYHSSRRGPAPQVLPTPSLGSELDLTAELLTNWLDEDTTPETVAVLVRDRWQRDRVEKGLTERGIEIRAVDREAVKPGRPVVMTMHRAKGTEFSKVVLFGINDGSIPAALKDEKYTEDAWADAMLRERSLLYVAATRARDELAVTWSGQKSGLLG
jgi:superfamily I DNA/RNA helicase